MSVHLPWFRLYVEMIDDEKMRLLAFEDRWHYVALLCCKGAGLLDAGDGHDLLRRKLGVKLGLAMRELEAAALRLAEVGLIDAETFQPLGWDDRQMRSDSSRDRVAAFRERKREAAKRPGNVTVTAQDTDSDSEVDTDQKQVPRKRGSRLPPNWKPDSDLLTFAAARLSSDQVAEEVEKFRDYWTAKTGAAATKLDWQATFRNWIRNARPRGNYGTDQRGGGRRESAIERTERLHAELDRRDGLR
jgi:hypothetical protein